MTYVLDMNVISEPLKPRPDSRVVAWLRSVAEDRFFLSVLTLGEIRRGTGAAPEGARRQRLAEWLTVELPGRFEGRILDIDQPIADAWGAMMAAGQRRGMPASALDAFLAATAQVYGLILVTRNVRHLEPQGVPLLNRWDEPSPSHRNGDADS